MPRTPRNGLSSGGWLQEAQRLVGAGVERADDHRPPVERGRDLRVDLALLVLGRRVVAVEEQELGAQQPDAVGAELDRRGRLGHRADVRGDLERLAVRDVRAGSRARSRARAAFRSAASWRAPLALGERPPSGGSTSTVPASPSTTISVVPSATRQHRLTEPDHRRDRRARGRGSRRARSPRRAPPPGRCTSSRSSAAASPGVRSRTTRSTPSAMIAAAAGAPVRWRSTRPPTSSTSTARSCRYGSSSARYASAVALRRLAPRRRRRSCRRRSPPWPARAAPRRRAAAGARRRSPPRPRRPAWRSAPARPRCPRAPPASAASSRAHSFRRVVPLPRGITS